MAFILSKDFDFEIRDNIPAFNTRWDEYRAYLKDLKGEIPDAAYEFANADWHYTPSDARCPHDAWLEEINFNEIKNEDGKFKVQYADITLKLLGAYHNGYLELTYKNVHSYSFVSGRGFRIDAKGEKGRYFHGDWLKDEVRLSENALVLHEIEWEHADWLIECKDIECNWMPFDPNAPTLMLPAPEL